MKKRDFPVSRRQYLKQMGSGIAAYTLAAQPLFAAPSSGRRQVLVMSDLHIGKVQDGLDGNEWLAQALEDLKDNVGPISYGLTLGDISQNGDQASILKYIKLRDASTIPQWFELAGNHEYYQQGITNYTSLIRSTEPYLFIDGNIAWFFISDEENSRIGNMSPETCRWLRKNIQIHKDKVIIVCSHQLPANTIRRSNEDVFCLHPKEEVENLLQTGLIDLWLCGHEHAGPYSKESFTRKENTTVINVASMSHAYGTTRSGSYILEFAENSKHITARRRIHDTSSFSDEFTMKIPLRNAISLEKTSNRDRKTPAKNKPEK